MRCFWLANIEEEKNIDQAKELKQLFEEVESNQGYQRSKKEDEQIKIDILNLPPRKEVHNQKQFFLRINFNRAFMRFLFVIFLLAIIIYLLLYKNTYIIFENFFTIP